MDQNPPPYDIDSYIEECFIRWARHSILFELESKGYQQNEDGSITLTIQFNRSIADYLRYAKREKQSIMKLELPDWHIESVKRNYLTLAYKLLLRPKIKT